MAINVLGRHCRIIFKRTASSVRPKELRKGRLNTMSLQQKPQAGRLEGDDDYAKEFLAAHEDEFLYDNSQEQFHRLRDGVFEPVHLNIIRELLADMVEPMSHKYSHDEAKKFKSTQTKNGILQAIQIFIDVDGKDFDTDPLLLGVQNGVIDLRTGLLTTIPSSIVTKRCSVAFDPNADCPLFKKFISEIMGGDRELIGYVRRMLGYCLTGHVNEQVFFIAIGSGLNGKSTLYNTILKIMGDYGCTTHMSTLMVPKYGDEKTYDLANLKGKRFVIAQEGEQNAKLAEAKIKAMTGGDVISYRQIRERVAEYQPYFKLVLSTNNLPKIDGVDEAIWRRIKLIPFNVTFAREKADETLKDKIMAEGSGILNFLLECHKEYTVDRLSTPERVEKEIADYKSMTDTVGQFMEERCVLEKTAKETSTILYKSYCSWCSENGVDPLTQSYFGRNLSLKGLISVRSASGMAWKGIRLSTDNDFQSRISQDNDAFEELQQELARKHTPFRPSSAAVAAPLQQGAPLS
jgi:putative DNA primase/helicase